MSEPSVLTYARHFRLTKNYASTDPINHIHALCRPSDGLDAVQSVGQSCEGLVEAFKTAAGEYVSLQSNDHLVVSQSVTHYLKSCTHYPIHDLDQLYKDLLPDPYRYRKFKIELPLLKIGGGDVSKDTRKVRRGVIPEIVIEKLLLNDEENEKENVNKDRNRGSSEQEQSPTMSTTSAEILKWSQSQAEAAMKREKLEVGIHTIKYLQTSLPRSINPTELCRILQNVYPSRATSHTETAPAISEADFDCDSDTEDPAVAIMVDSATNTCQGNKLQDPPKEDSRISDQSDIAVDKEQFVLSTQMDREMEDLFREFTNHHSNDSTWKTSIDTSNELPPAKRRKLNHDDEDESMPNPVTAVSHGAGSPAAQLKVEIPVLDESLRTSLPEIDLAALFGSRCSGVSPLQTFAGPGEPPFHIPPIHETLHETPDMSPTTLEKYLVQNRTILSSDKLLWKEPGVRVLDIAEDLESTLFVEDFDIEDQREAVTLTNHEQQYQPERLCPVNEDRPRANSSHKLRDLKKPVLVERSAPQTDIRKDLAVKEEQRSSNFDQSIPFVLQNPRRPHPSSCSETELESRLRGSTDAERPPIHTKHENGFRSPPIDCGDRKPRSKQREQVVLESLVPKWRRDQFVPGNQYRSTHSTSDPLSSFLDLRGKLKIIQKHSRDGDLDDDPILSTQNSLVERCFNNDKLVKNLQVEETSNRPEVLPPLKPLHEPRTIIVNHTLLRSKPLLIQFLERQDDAHLTLIYRDLDCQGYQGPDLLLDVSTCLTITSLQSLKQRPLPGQRSLTDLSAMHDRITSLASTYSKIIVLVHYSNLETSGVGNQKAFPQASFAAFCASISRRSSGQYVQPYWLLCENPASAAEIVNTWVWSIIGQHAYRNNICDPLTSAVVTKSILIQDETLWEIFLCNAGLNPLAAQLVIGSLKKPAVIKVETLNNEASWGLRRLVAMRPQERMEMFGGMIGHGVVNRLNTVLSMDMR